MKENKEIQSGQAPGVRESCNADCRAKCDEYLNNWKRAQADFENYRKNEAHRMQELLRFADERVILEVADIIDNLEMVFKHAPPDIGKEWLTGAEHVLREWQEFLKRHGVKRIETVGQIFDPHRHEAVQVGDHEKEHKVTEEIRAGYMTGDKVIRPARVKIN